MEREMKDLIQDYRNLSGNVWVPTADVYENDRQVMIFVDIPGVNPDQVKITLGNRSILITGERPGPLPRDVLRIHQMEIDAGVFKRRIPLPGPVDFERSHSTYKNGLLKIVLPKKQKPETIQISIETE